MSAVIKRDFSVSDVDVVSVAGASFEKHYVTIHPCSSGDTRTMAALTADFLRRTGARVVQQDCFGPCARRKELRDALREQSVRVEDWPMTWIHANGSTAPAMTGTQFYAVSGVIPHPIMVDGRLVGQVLESDDASYCLMGDLLPSDTGGTRGEQTRKVLDLMAAALAQAGMDFSHMVRTWFYLDHILDWYDEFNVSRTSFFEEYGVFDGLVPASTGVGGGNCSGAALTADALAIRPKNDAVKIQEVDSPLQCSALDYRSSFSRAVEVQLADHRRLYVSGTASIAPDGRTVHVDDAEQQVALSMDVVEAILLSRKLSWSNVSRAVAYFKDMSSRPLLDAYCANRKLPALPIAIAHSDICRDDLLFEIEVDAVAS